MRRILMIVFSVLGWIVLCMLALVTTLVLAGLIAARTDWGHRKLLSVLLPVVQQSLDGKLRIGRLGGSLTRNLELDDLEIDDPEGELAVRIRRAVVRYNLIFLLRHTIHLDDIELDGVVVHARHLRDGRFNLAALQKPSPPSDNPYKIFVGHAWADAETRYRSSASRRSPPAFPEIRGQLLIDGGATIDGDVMDVRLDSLVASTRVPAVALVRSSGGLHADHGVLTLKRVSLVVQTSGNDVNRLVAGARLIGRYRMSLDADGPLSDLKVKLALRPPKGSLDVNARLGVGAPGFPWSGQARLQRLDPGAVWRGVPHGDVELDVRGEGRGAHGSLDLHRLVASLAGMRAAARGKSDLAGYGKLDLEVDAPDLSRLAGLGGLRLRGKLSALAQVARNRAHLAVDAQIRGSALDTGTARVESLSATAHTVDLTGQVQLQASGVSAAKRRIDRVTLNARGGRQSLEVHLAANANGPRPTSLQLDIHGRPIERRGRTIGADTVIDRLLVSADQHTWQTKRPARLRIDRAVTLSELRLGSEDQEIGLDGQYIIKGGAFDAELSTRKLDIAKLVALVNPSLNLPSTNLDARVHAGGTKDAPVADLELKGTMKRFDWGKLQKLMIDPVAFHVRASYAGERVKGDLEATSAVTQLRVRADAPLTFGGERPLSVELDVEKLALRKLNPVLPAQVAAADGTLNAKLRVQGTTRNPEFDFQVGLTPWQLEEFKNNSSTINVSYHQGMLKVNEETLLMRGLTGPQAGAIRAELAVPIDLGQAIAQPAQALEQLEHTTPIRAAVTIKAVDLGKLPLEFFALSRPLESGVLDSTMQLEGTLHQPVLHVTLSGKGLSKLGSFDHLDVSTELDYARTLLRLTSHLALRGAPLVNASGQAEVDFQKVIDGERWQQSPIQLDVSIPGYDLKRLRGTQPQLDTLDGSLVADAKVRGSFARPEAQLSAHVDALTLGRVRFSSFQVSGAFKNQAVQAALRADQERGGSFAADASVPLAATQAWKMSAVIHRLSLDFLSGTLESLRTATGTLEAQLAIAGTRSQPNFDAEVQIDKGSFQLRVDPHIYKNLQLDVGLHKGQLAVRKLSLNSGDGSLKATGKATLNGLRPTALQADAETRKFAITAGDFAAWLDTTISADAEQQGDILNGRVRVSKGVVHLPKLETGRKLQPVGELDDVVYTDRLARQARQEAAAKHTETRLQLSIPGPFLIRSKEAYADLQGKLELDVKGPTSNLTGVVETVSGWVELLSRRYTIERLRVSFDGPPDNPSFEVRLTRQLTEANIIVEVAGTAKSKKLDFRLSSDPPIYDESQIIGIIISGDPASQRVSNTALDRQVTGAVSGLIIGKVKDAIAPQLPVDVIKLDTGGQDYAGVTQTRLEVGKYLSDNVYLSYVHQFGSSSGLHRLNSNEAHVEYRFLRRFELDTVFGDAGVGGIDLYWTYRY